MDEVTANYIKELELHHNSLLVEKEYFTKALEITNKRIQLSEVNRKTYQ